MSKKITVKADVKLYFRLLKYLKHYKFVFALAMLGNMLFSAITGYFPYLLKPILNQGLIARDAHFLHTLPYMIFAVFIARGAANVLGTYCMACVSRGIVMLLRQDVFMHLLKMPASAYDKTSAGQMISVILYNVEQVANAGASALTDLVQSGFLILTLLVAMLSINWRLSLFYLVVVPVVIISVRKSSKRLRHIGISLQDQMGEVTSIAEETVQGYKVVRIFGGQEYEQKRFNRATKINRWRELKSVLTKSLTVSGIQILLGGIISLIIFLALSKQISGNISPGAFAALMGSMLALLKPLKSFTNVNATIQKGLAGAQSIFELLDDPLEVDSGSTVIDRVKGEIAFEHVSFVYDRTDKHVLSDINFKVPAGSCVALVGRSGGGKTTLVNALQRFYLLKEGVIKIDGVDINEFTLANLRQQFSLVSQHVTLFNDTVAHNISYGRFDDATEAEIIAAAKAANAWEFIEPMPNGLKTIVGDNGVLLSGGQRQRLAIARAIIKDAPILILDEATSALDTESEREIQSALEGLMQNRTTFVIAHRLSTIENADIILVLDHGQLVESGTHEELLALDGYYARLYRMQFKDDAAVNLV